MKLADQAKAIRRLIRSNPPLSEAALHAALSDATTDLEGNTALHHAAALGLLDKVPLGVLKTLFTAENLTKPNNSGVTVLDSLKLKQQRWVIPPEIIKPVLQQELVQLRGHQIAGRDNHQAWFNKPIDPADFNTREGLIWASTGSGKTTLAAACIQDLLNANKKVLWVVHDETLMDQAREAIEELTGEPCEYEKAGLHASGKARIVIASVQSLKSKRLEDFSKRFSPDAIFFDEAHRSVAASYIATRNIWPQAKIVNLTATPYRSDIKDRLNLGETLLYYPFEQAVKDGWCVEPKFVDRLMLDLTGVKTKFKDYEEKSLSAAMCSEENVAACLELLKNHIPGQRSLLFAASVTHGKIMTERLRDLGFAVEEVYGENTDRATRADYIGKLKTNKIQVLVNYNVFKEGTDIPELTQVLYLRPTKNDVLWLQSLYRACRVDKNNPDKTYFSVVDAVDRKKHRMGKVVAWPTEQDMSRVRLVKGRNVSVFEAFLDRFRLRSEMVQESSSGVKATTTFTSAKAVYGLLHPTRPIPNPDVTALEGMWETLNDDKTIAKALSLLGVGDINVLTKLMVQKGCVYMASLAPKNIDDLEDLVESNEADFGTKPAEALDPSYSLFGTPVNYITAIEDEYDKTEQLINHSILPVTYGEREVYWRIPLNGGDFNYLDYDENLPGLKSWMFVRDTKTGKVAAFYKDRKVGIDKSKGTQFSYIPKDAKWCSSSKVPDLASLPGYCVGPKSRDPKAVPSWMREGPSSGQVRSATEAVARFLKISETQAAVKVAKFNKSQASSVISANKNMGFLDTVKRDYPKVKDLMIEPLVSGKHVPGVVSESAVVFAGAPAPTVPTSTSAATSATIAAVERAEKPANAGGATKTITVGEALNGYKKAIENVARLQGVSHSRMTAAANKSFWTLKPVNKLTVANVETLLGNPGLMLDHLDDKPGSDLRMKF